MLGAVALLSLGVGVAAAELVVSPADLAARTRAPEAGPIFAPVERRVVANTVTARADVTYADAVDVAVDTSGLAGPAVVTGRVPEVGATIDAGGVALEVAGRPVIVLPGGLPAYRTVRAGQSGPDVLQLKAALKGLGIEAGDPASSSYDATTAAGVAELYRRVGYAPPTASPDAAAAVQSAASAERAAEAALGQARAALEHASAGARLDATVEADNAVRQAQRALADATDAAEPESVLARLRDELSLAVARRDTVLTPPVVAAEAAAVTAAEQQLADARAARATAETDALTPLPAGEVVFLPTLPRRVDGVEAVQGEVAKGALMSVSGAALHLEGSLGHDDAALVKAGMTAEFSTADGSRYPATVKEVGVKKTGSGSGGASDTGSESADSGSGSGGTATRYDLTLDPGTLPAEVIDRIRGSNVKVDIPVQATAGDVLAVPVAALSAGAGGESRVELEVAAGPGSAGTSNTEIVEVTTGLAAGGYVEVRSDDPRLVVGARVVVGR
ncbi:hypothetical protein ACEXQB_009040 [Herbiconiux sp. P18]|uniref:hypothetical protein n=1 Tax=Herbiconiux liangxiaofengii TaxID=3342795 RepID=UPI0035BC6B4B